MDVKIHTPNWEIIDSGSVFLDEEFLEFIIEGLTFRLIVKDNPEDGSDKTNPYVNYEVEEIEGVKIMMIRAYNYASNELTTLTKSINIAKIKGRELRFRFASSRVRSEGDAYDYLIHYCWYLAKD